MANGKVGWFKFYPRDWLAEPRLSGMSVTVHGIWINLLSVMWVESNACVTGTRNAIAWIARCEPEELDDFLEGAKNTGFADVTESNGVISITSRRVKQDLKDYEEHGESKKEANRERQRRFRERHGNETKQSRNAVSNALVTPLPSSSSSDSVSNSSSQNKNPDRRLGPGLESLRTQYREAVEERNGKARSNQDTREGQGKLVPPTNRPPDHR